MYFTFSEGTPGSLAWISVAEEGSQSEQKLLQLEIPFNIFQEPKGITGTLAGAGKEVDAFLTPLQEQVKSSFRNITAVVTLAY